MTDQITSVEPSSRPSQAADQSGTRITQADALSWIRRNALYIGLILVVVCLSAFWVCTQDLNPTTDDAQVDGHTIMISPRIPGYVLKMYIDDNVVVSPNDLMIQLDPADYQARVDQARAALQVAEAKAASLKIIVPFIVSTTTSTTAAANAQVTGATADLDRASTTYNQLATSELRFAQANVAAMKAEMDRAEMDEKRTPSLAQLSEISHQQYDAYVATAQVLAGSAAAA